MVSIYLLPTLTVYCCAVMFAFGACMGSFLNCMAWRIVHGESVRRGRSHCDVCGHVLAARDLIPIASFLAQGGRCRFCGAQLSRRHVVCELWAGISCTALLLKYDISLQGLEMLVLTLVLLASAFADLEGYIIPDRFIAAGILLRIPFFFAFGWRRTLPDALLGGFAVGGALLVLVLVYERVRGIDAMGGGDLKLLFVTGLYLGWKRNLLCLLLACVLGIAFALTTRTARREQTDERLFPWGPSIAAAAILTALMGEEAVAAYLSLF